MQLDLRHVIFYTLVRIIGGSDDFRNRKTNSSPMEGRR